MKTLFIIIPLFLAACDGWEPIVKEKETIIEKPYPVPVPVPVRYGRDFCQKKYRHCYNQHHWKTVWQCKRERSRCYGGRAL